MPAGLRKHVRYPELLLKLQAAVYGLYHMTDPGGVLQPRGSVDASRAEVGMNDAARAGDAADGAELRADEAAGRDERSEFVEILPFTPANRNNLIGWIAGRSDGEHYGTARRLRLPEDAGWSTARCRSKRASIRTRSSRASCRCGTSRARTCAAAALIVIPIGRALLYAEPIYLQAERSPMPELRLVVLALQDRLAYGPTFEAALAGLFGRRRVDAPTAAAPRRPRRTPRRQRRVAAAPARTDATR